MLWAYSRDSENVLCVDDAGFADCSRPFGRYGLLRSEVGLGEDVDFGSCVCSVLDENLGKMIDLVVSYLRLSSIEACP